MDKTEISSNKREKGKEKVHKTKRYTRGKVGNQNSNAIQAGITIICCVHSDHSFQKYRTSDVPHASSR